MRRIQLAVAHGVLFAFSWLTGWAAWVVSREQQKGGTAGCRFHPDGTPVGLLPGDPVDQSTFFAPDGPFDYVQELAKRTAREKEQQTEGGEAR